MIKSPRYLTDMKAIYFITFILSNILVRIKKCNPIKEQKRKISIFYDTFGI